jgi:hypothetical protein
MMNEKFIADQVFDNGLHQTISVDSTHSTFK